MPMSWLGILHIYNIWNPVIRNAIYLVVRKFYLRGFFCQTRNLSRSSMCGVLIYKRAMDLKISVYFHQIVPIRFKIK